MLPIIGVLLRLFATGALAGVSISARVAAVNSNKIPNVVKTIHALQLEERNIRKERIELEEELRIIIRLRDSMLEWTETLEDETHISASIYKELCDLRFRASELSEELGIKLDEFKTLRGAKRTRDQILKLSQPSE
jgi:hypothetical protein